MSLNASQEDDFAQDVFGRYKDVLENTISWIKENLHPDDVFDEKELEEYIEENASDSFGPDDLFSESELVEWAEENGYEKKEKEK